MIVAIIDDGIFEDEITVPVEKYHIGKPINISRYSHATICAKIIEKYGNIDKFIDIQFINSYGESNIKLMCLALEKCLEINVDVINLSNGIDSFYDGMPYYERLSFICEKLNNKGVIICAAQSNSLKRTIPATFHSTISVEQIDLKSNVLCTPYRISDIYTEGKHSIIVSGKQYITEKCNSYACAYATSQISTRRFQNNKIFKIYRATITNNLLLKFFICHNHRLYPNLEIPIIYIESFDTDDMYQMIKKLMTLFAKYGYNSEEIVSNSRLKKMGLNYIAREYLFRYIKILCFNTKSDIVIVATHNYHLNNNREDIIIKKIDKGYKIQFNNKVLYSSDLSLVVNSIIKYYT